MRRCSSLKPGKVYYGTQFIVVGKVWWLKPKAAAHFTSAVRKQRTWMLGSSLLSLLSPHTVCATTDLDSDLTNLEKLKERTNNKCAFVFKFVL